MGGEAAARAVRVVSWNVNGLPVTLKDMTAKHGSAAAYFRGVLRADILCLQETKLQDEKLEGWMACVEGYQSYWAFSRAKKGYSGVVTYVSEEWAPCEAAADAIDPHGQHWATCATQPDAPGSQTALERGAVQVALPSDADPTPTYASKAIPMASTPAQPGVTQGVLSSPASAGAEGMPQSCNGAAAASSERGSAAPGIELAQAPGRTLGDEGRAVPREASKARWGGESAKASMEKGAERGPSREAESPLAQEGRVVRTDHGSFVLLNVYAPNAGERKAGRPRLAFKLAFLAALKSECDRLAAEGRNVVLVGDLNISHRDIDVYYQWRADQIYCAEELDWMQSMVGGAPLAPASPAAPTRAGSQDSSNDAAREGAGLDGAAAHEDEGSRTQGIAERENSRMPEGSASARSPYVDLFRHFHPRARNMFTVWDQRTDARPRNEGQRIDYTICNRGLLPCVQSAEVLNTLTPKAWSDHAPVALTLVVVPPSPPPSPPALWLSCQARFQADPSQRKLTAMFQRRQRTDERRQDRPQQHGTGPAPVPQTAAEAKPAPGPAASAAVAVCEPAAELGQGQENRGEEQGRGGIQTGEALLMEAERGARVAEEAGAGKAREGMVSSDGARGCEIDEWGTVDSTRPGGGISESTRPEDCERAKTQGTTAQEQAARPAQASSKRALRPQGVGVKRKRAAQKGEPQKKAEKGQQLLASFVKRH